MSDRESNFGDILTGLIIGAAIGYVAAMLSAPRSGEETRQMIEDKGRELRTRARDTVSTTVDKTGKLVSEGRERVEQTVGSTVNRTLDRANEVKERGVSAVEDVRSQASETIRRAADRVDPNTPGSSTSGQETAS